MNSVELKNKIINYYDTTYWNYRIGWGINRHYNIHYGLYSGNCKNHDDAVENMNRELAKKLDIKSSSIILDAGCGIGGSAIWLSKKFGVNVFGITLSKKQRDLARKLAKKNKVEKLAKFFVRDFLDTKFPDDFFDIVWAIESVCYAQDKEDFLAEAKRILKKDGQIIVADFFLNKSDLSFEYDKMVKDWLSGWFIPNLTESFRFKEILRKTGFKNIKNRNVSEDVLISSKRIYFLGLIGCFFGKVYQAAVYKK